MGGVDSNGPSPLRTCVGCRQRAPQQDLIRVVASAGALVPDPTRRLPGRGAYVHPSSTCLERALSRRAFSRALRSDGVLDPAGVQEHLAQVLQHPDSGARP